VAAALQGVDIQREFGRNAVRSGKMMSYLREQRRRLRKATDLNQLRAAARDTEALMLHENRDWFMVMQVHDVER